MSKRLQGLIAGVLIGVMLSGSVAFAQRISKTAQLVYNNIKIFIDGGEIVPKDANGNLVEPFIMNGTTYLPVRAVSNAFGKDVVWDGVNQSVYIGKKDQTKPDNYLQKIQYNDYKEGINHNNFTIINGTVTDFNKTVYKNGLLFYVYSIYSTLEDDADAANSLIAYPLNSMYSNLKGKIVIPKEYHLSTWGEKKNCEDASVDVWFYGDGQGALACCNSWGRKESDMTEQLN